MREINIFIRRDCQRVYNIIYKLKLIVGRRRRRRRRQRFVLIIPSASRYTTIIIKMLFKFYLFYFNRPELSLFITLYYVRFGASRTPQTVSKSVDFSLGRYNSVYRSYIIVRVYNERQRVIV